MVKAKGEKCSMVVVESDGGVGVSMARRRVGGRIAWLIQSNGRWSWRCNNNNNLATRNPFLFLPLPSSNLHHLWAWFFKGGRTSILLFASVLFQFESSSYFLCIDFHSILIVIFYSYSFSTTQTTTTTTTVGWLRWWWPWRQCPISVRVHRKMREDDHRRLPLASNQNRHSSSSSNNNERR